MWNATLLGVYVVAPLRFRALPFFPGPRGRQMRGKAGSHVDTGLAWVLVEAPASDESKSPSSEFVVEPVATAARKTASAAVVTLLLPSASAWFVGADHPEAFGIKSLTGDAGVEAAVGPHAAALGRETVRVQVVERDPRVFRETLESAG